MTAKLSQLATFITRIKSEATHYLMSGGLLCVNERNYDDFVKTYVNLIDSGFQLDVVEKQANDSVRRICIDFDFKSQKTSSKQPERSHITSIFSEIINEIIFPQLTTYCELTDKQEIEYCVFVRDAPYLKENTIKDGVHVVFNLKMEQSVWNKLIVSQFSAIEERLHEAGVNFENAMDDVIDKAFLNGSGNWILYGSDKPANFETTTPYKLIEKITAIFNSNTNDFTFDFTPDSEIEAYTTSELYNLKTIKDNPNVKTIDVKKHHIIEKKPKLKLIVNEEPAPTAQSLNPLYVELIESIGTKFIDAYSSWRDIIWAMCYLGEDYKSLAKKISGKSAKWTYDSNAEEIFEKLWATCEKSHFTLGTLKHYSRLTDEKSYLIIQGKFKEFQKICEGDSDNEIAQVFVHLFEDDFVYENEELWRWGGIVWELDNKQHFLRGAIAKKLKLFYRIKEEQFNKQKQENDDETIIKMIDSKIKKVQNIQRYVQSTTGSSNIMKMVLTELATQQTNKKIWDSKPYLFAFTNVIYDLRNGSNVSPNKFDYMRLSTGYEWRDPTQEECDELSDVFNKIYPIESTKILYLTILATGLLGRTLEKFTVASGKGGNGKGVTNELMCDTVGNYGYVLASTALQVSQTSLGSCPELAQLAYKRFVVCREPDNKKKINIAILKELTGGDTFKARTNYSTKTEQPICMTLVMELNPPRPQLGGKADNALLRRLIEVPFISTFTQNQSEVSEENNIYLGNQNVKTREWKTKHRFAMFAMLSAYAIKYYENNEMIDSFIPPEIKELSREYVFGSDEVFSWFKSSWRYTGKENDVIKVQDAVSSFRSTEIYKTMDREEKKQINREFIKASLDNDLKLSKSYHERFRKRLDTGKQVEIRNCWSGWVIDDENQSDEEELID